MEKNTIYPKYIKTEDDLRFVLRNYGLTRKDITVISHAFSLVKSKDSAMQIFANLAGKNSLLSENARMLASVIAKGRYINHAINVWLTVVHKRYKNEKQDKYTNKSVYSNNKVDNHNNYYFWKLQTNQNFREWSKSILQRAQPDAKLLLDKFISNKELKLVFACKKPYPIHTSVYFSFSADKTMRKHLLMQGVFTNHKLRAIIDSESFKIYLLVENKDNSSINTIY